MMDFARTMDALSLLAGCIILTIKFGWEVGIPVWLIAQAIRPYEEVE